MIPSSRSPWWGLVAAVLALAIPAAVLGIGALRHGPPPLLVIGGVASVTAGPVAALTLLGFLGARATFTWTLLGLLLGLANMLRVAMTNDRGSDEFEALAFFVLFGFIGLVVGGVIDSVRVVRSYSQKPRPAEVRSPAADG